MKQTAKAQHTDKNMAISYAGYRFPPELISYAVWLYFRFPLSLRMVDEMLAARGMEVTYETVRRWALKFAQKAARRIRARRSTFGDKWHLDEVVTPSQAAKAWLRFVRFSVASTL